MALRLSSSNFSKGELAPELLGRFDVPTYNAGLARARNVCILKYGGVTKRPGTRVVAEAYDDNHPVRLIPFQFGLEDAYALENGDNYMRPIALGGNVLETAKTITAITKAASAQISATAHGYSNGDQVFITANGMRQINGQVGTVTVVNANAFTVGINSSAYSTFTSGTVARVVRITSPYDGNELDQIDFEQSADTMYLAHLSHPPYKLLRSSHTSWQYTVVTFGPDNTPPTGLIADDRTPNEDEDNDGNAYFPQPATYVVTSVNDDTGQESRASVSATTTNDLGLKRNRNELSWVAPVDGLADRYRIFKAENQQEYGYIGSTAAFIFRDDNIGPDLSDGPPIAENPFDASNKYPSTVTFYQQRLFWGRTTEKPNGVWASKVGDYENMDIARPLQDDDALSFAPVAKGVNAINQLVPMEDLLVLTSDNIFSVNGGNDEFLSPSNLVIKGVGGQGASRLGPIVVDSGVLFQPAVGSAVRMLGFNEGYKSSDLTIFSPHFFEGHTIIDWAYVREPRSQVWAVRDDGVLMVLTLELEQEVWGWSRCDMDGTVESVCSIAEQGEDRLYLTVRRTLNGVEKLFIERMASALWDGIENACFLDCAVTVDNTAPSATVYGLSHLAGVTVSALADGNVCENLVVDAQGTLTLPYEASVVTVGLPYTATIETLPLAVQTRSGWTIAKPSDTGEVVLKVVNTRGIFVGPTDDTLREIKPRMDEAYADPNGLITGNCIPMDMPSVVRDALSVVVSMPYPLPCTISSILFDPIVAG